MALDQVLDVQKAALAAGDEPAFAEADRRFHITLVESARNMILLELYASLRDRQLRMNLGSLDRGPHRPHEILAQHEAIVDALGLSLNRAAYLDDTGHMSGVDPLLALDRAVRSGDIRDGDLVLLLAAGTGYTWAASVVRWGPSTAP